MTGYDYIIIQLSFNELRYVRNCNGLVEISGRLYKRTLLRIRDSESQGTSGTYKFDKIIYDINIDDFEQRLDWLGLNRCQTNECIGV